METLAERIARDGPVNELDAIGWAIRLAKRLEALHVLGVAHGSVSPACILTAGQDRNARAYLADVQHTSSSPAYQSPERILGGDISVADDVWALAATLYALLTGQSPFVGVNDADCRQKILAASPAPLAVYDVGDDDLQHIIDHAFAREVGWRISSVAALRRSLEEWHPDRGVAVLPPLEDEDSTNDDEDVARTMMVRDAGSYLQQNLQIPVSPSRQDDDDDDDDNVRTVMRQMPGGDLAALIAKATAAQHPAAPAPAPAPAARPVPQRKATVQGLPPPQAPFSPPMPAPPQAPFAPAPPPQAPPPRMAMPQPQPPPPRPPPYGAGMRGVGQPGTPQPGPPQPPFPQPGQSPYGQPPQNPYGQPPQNPYGQPPQQQAATPPAPPVFASAFGGRPLPPPQPDDDDDDEDEGARTVMRSPEQLAAEGAQDARTMMGKDGAPGPWQQPPGPRPAGGMAPHPSGAFGGPPRGVELQGPPTPRTPGQSAPRALGGQEPPAWSPMNQGQRGGPGPAPTMALPMYEEGNAAYPGAPPLDPRLGGGTNPMGIHGFDPREHDPDMLGGGTNPMGMPGFDGRAPAFLQGPPPPQQYQQPPQQQPPQQQGPAFGGLAAPGDLSALEGPPGGMGQPGMGPQVMGGMPSGQYPQSQIDPASAGLARPPARGGRAVLVIAALVALLIAAGLTYFVLRSRMH